MEDPYNSVDNASDATEKQGKRSAKESAPGSFVGFLVGLGLAYITKKSGIQFPDGTADVVSAALVGLPAALGGIISSFHLGNRR